MVAAKSSSGRRWSARTQRRKARPAASTAAAAWAAFFIRRPASLAVPIGFRLCLPYEPLAAPDEVAMGPPGGRLVQGEQRPEGAFDHRERPAVVAHAVLVVHRQL